MCRKMVCHVIWPFKHTSRDPDAMINGDSHVTYSQKGVGLRQMEDLGLILPWMAFYRKNGRYRSFLGDCYGEGMVDGGLIRVP